MDRQRIDALVGIPYHPRHMDCADFLLMAVLRLIGREVLLPGKRPRPLRDDAQAAALAAAVRQLAVRTELPQNGDLVLMANSASGAPGHAGMWLFVDHQPQVLHCSAAVGASRLHRMRELQGLGYHVEGVYRWI